MKIKNKLTVVIDAILHTPNPSREGRLVTTSSMNRLGVATDAIFSPLERGGGVLLLLIALLAFLFTSCEATDVISERETSAPLRLGASIEQSGIATRAGGDLTIREGGSISLTIEWIGEQPTATIAFVPATARLTIQVNGTAGDTNLSNFYLTGNIFGTLAMEGEEYLFDQSGRLLYDSSAGVVSGTVTDVVPFTIAADAPMFTLSQMNAASPYYGKTYTVANTSGDTFTAEAGRHYSITVALQREAAPIAFITDITAAWDVQPEKQIPYKADYDITVASAADLIAFRTRVNKGETRLRVLQTADINLTGSWTPIGNDAYRFSGVYNGNGYTINNLTVNTSSSERGLFGYVGPGALLTGIHLKGATVTEAGTYAALLAARVLANSQSPAVISLCSATGTVSGVDYVGGLVGEGWDVHISRSRAVVTLTGSRDGVAAGGIIASITRGEIFGCSSNATITTTASTILDHLGGLAGAMTGTGSSVAFSHSEGTITSTATLVSHVGGLVGKMEAGTAAYSYSDCRLSPKPSDNPSLFYGALIGTLGSGATLSRCNTNLAASGTDAIVGEVDGTVENNNTTAKSTRLKTVTTTNGTTVASATCNLTTIWDSSGYGKDAVRRTFSATGIWTNKESPTINYGYNGIAAN